MIFPNYVDDVFTQLTVKVSNVFDSYLCLAKIDDESITIITQFVDTGKTDIIY